MSFAYIVQKGDTIDRIARRYAVNAQSLYAANPQLRPGWYVYPGQVLAIPQRPNQQYVVQAGETFAQIAKLFNIDAGELAAANPDADPRRLRIGQRITLPGGKSRSIVQVDGDYGYAELMEHIRRLAEKYPSISVASIGESVLGKPIPVIRIGSGPCEIHYNGAFHANEWITSVLLMKFIEQAADAQAEDRPLRGCSMRRLFERVSLWVVPMVNPDGVELVLEGAASSHPFYERLLAWNCDSPDFSGWKANIRGVDLNDQFPAFWEEERQRRAVAGPGPRDYSGTAPLSEPEAAAMAHFTRSRNFRLVIAFHTQGQEIYWNYRDMEPEETETIARRFGQKSRYKPVKLSGSDAGYKDWFIQEFRRPGFTVEAGVGINPLPAEQFHSMYEDCIGIMLEALQVEPT